MKADIIATVRFLRLSLACGLLTGLLGLPQPAVAGSFDGTEKGMALSRLTPKYKRIYWGLSYILNPHQRRQFLMLSSDAERDDWLRVFWAQNDPTPSTEINERKVEHEKRVEAARQFFPSSKAPGWDRRGEILIRFGAPPIRNKTFGETTTTRYYPPGEQWFYPHLGMLVEFEEIPQGGEYVFAMTQYPYELFSLQITENDPQHKDDDLTAVLSEGNERKKTSSRPAPAQGELPKTIDYVQWSEDELAGFRKDLIATWEKEKIEDLRETFRKVEAETPAIFSYDLKMDKLWFVFDVEDFYGGKNAARVEFYCQIPTRDIGFAEIDGNWKTMCRFTVVVQDLDYREITRESRTVEAVFTSEDAAGLSTFIPTQIQLPLPPGYYRLVFDVEDRLTEKRGSYRTNFQVRSFDRGLRLSGIEFASHIGEAENTSPFVKGPLSVIPHPVKVYSTSHPVSLYFEIYGLALDADGLSQYEVTYAITAHNPRRGPHFWDKHEEARKAVTSSFEASSYDSRDTQYLSIDTSTLWADTFDLEVEVTDKITGRSARVLKTFRILQAKN